MQCSADNAFDSEILEKFFIDIEKNKIGIDLIEELLRCSDENSFNEKILRCFLKKCNAEGLSLNAMKNLIKCCPNEIFVDHFSEILYKCHAKVFDNEFVSEVFKIKSIIFSEEVTLNFLKCCDKEIFDDKCYDNFKLKCEFSFSEKIILELIHVSDKKTIECKLSDIKTGYKGKSLNENILGAVLCKFENGEISSDLLNEFLKCFPKKVIQNNLINILEKCAKEVLNEENLVKLLGNLSARGSSEESVIWLFSNFPDEAVKNYSNMILQKLKGTSSNEEFLDLILKKGNMSINLSNLLVKKFGEDLLKKRLVDILEKCLDNSLFDTNCDNIFELFKKNDGYKISDKVINELVRCADSIDLIFDKLSYFCNNIVSSKELLNTILKKFKSQSKVITFKKFGDLLENFNDEIIKDNLIDILSKCEDNTLNEEISNKILDILGDEKISDELAKELIRCCDGKIFDSALINKFAEDFRFDKVTINKFLNNCNENFHFDETTTEKFYKCFEKQSVNSEILVKLLNRGFQFDIEVCKEDNFQIFDIDIFTSKNYKELCKGLEDKSAVKNFAALYNSYNKSNIKIGYGIGIGIGLLILLIAVGLSVATFGLGALAISPVAAIAAIAVTAAVGLTVTSVFSSFIHMLRLSCAMIIKDFIEQKYQEDNSIDVKKEMEEKIAPDLRFWLKVNESKSKKTNTNNEMEQPLLENSENQID